MRIEEYVPAATFMLASFSRDRAELVSRFSEFTTAYQDAFREKLEQIKSLEHALKLSEKQKQLTAELYLQGDALNRELNFLSFYFKRAALDPGIITAVKDDLRSRNIEGACLKLSALIQYVNAQQVLLTDKGMAVGFPAQLLAEQQALEAMNVQQHELMNTLSRLYAANRSAYQSLLEYVRVIAEAGKIMYDGDVREGEYTIDRIIGRMRAGGPSSKDVGV